MIDLAFLRANLDAVAERLAARGYTFDIAQFRELDLKRRAPDPVLGLRCDRHFRVQTAKNPGSGAQRHSCAAADLP